MILEPLIHSHITDVLPDDHPLAFETVYCANKDVHKGGGGMLHAGNNECMTTWVEAGRGNFCLSCFSALHEVNGYFEEEMGLESKEAELVVASKEHNGMVCVGCVPHQRATKDSCCSPNFTLDSSKRCLCCDKVMIK